MNKNIEIRRYQAADNAALSHIWFEASRRAHAFLGEERLTEQRKLIEQSYLPDAETWVALIDGKPVGFIGLLETFIGGLFVDPDRQGAGIGQALIAHALDLKRELSLQVYADNQQAVAFYKKLGFVEVSRQTHDDDGLPFANIEMRRTA